MKKKIPEKVINRLTLYHCILNDFIQKDEEYISSVQISSLLRIDDSQVRKDINLLNNSGKSRVGYNVKELKKSIETTLGFSKSKRAYIVGAGNLGIALANYGNFSSYGLNIISLFDNDINGSNDGLYMTKSFLSFNDKSRLTKDFSTPEENHFHAVNYVQLIKNNNQKFS